MDILFLSHTARTRVWRVGSHHLSRELSQQGHRVVHVSTPITSWHLLRILDPDTRERLGHAVRPVVDASGVEHRIIRMPFPLHAGPPSVRRVSGGLLRRSAGPQLERWAGHAGRPDVVLVDQPLFEPALDRRLDALVVYRPTDTYKSGRPGLEQAEERLLHKVDGLVCTSDGVLQWERRIPAAKSVPAIVLENGVEWQRFARATPSERLGPTAVYVGALDARFDWGLVDALATGAPDVRFQLAGPVTSAPRLPGNVELLGPVSYEDVPALLAQATIGLLPFSDHPDNASRSPMKYYEYLAAGLWVLGRRTDALSRRVAPGVILYEHPAEAIAGVARFASLARRNEDGSAAARDFDWGARARALMEFVEEVADRRTAGRPQRGRIASSGSLF